ncbi:MAG: hypothetical protein QM582_01975 [Micropruina sp.]|uniref:hypothetical protein n=1 Tax=Micropruina sp. TaxID=2737536 RepID=UPI0039E690EF
MPTSPPSSTVPPLAPRLSSAWRDFLADRELPAALVGGLGSPLNLVMPDQLVRNAEAFAAVHRWLRLRGALYFAHKANRSTALVRRIAATGFGVDVASVGELQHALGAGVPGARIMATGPKGEDFLWLSGAVGAVVNADSVDELERLGTLIRRHRLPPVRVMIRLSGFAPVGVAVLSRPSRFGVPVDQLDGALESLDRYRRELVLHGLAFHLDTTGLEEKALAVEGCLLAMAQCQARGHAPAAIDIGGGFGVAYLDQPEQWHSYARALNDSVLGRRTPITWAGYGYGLKAERGAVRGTLGVYPSHRDKAGPAYLEALLEHHGPRLRRPLSTVLLESLVELHVEPGRALLDQVGLTLVSVREVRDGPDGSLLVGLDANRHDVSAEEHGVLVDPLLLPAGGVRTGQPVSAYLLGNLCLENDLITRRAVHLPAPPRPGDLLAFANTGGYFMDFAATDALMQHRAATVAVRAAGSGWRWCLDADYWPTEGEEQ